MKTRRVFLGIAGAAVVASGSWLVTGRPVRYGTLASVETSADSTPSPGPAIERVTLTTSRGRTLTCLLRGPAAPPSPSGAPALLVAGGRRTGRNAVRYLDSAYAGMALSCDYPWAELVRLRGARFLLRLPRLRAEIVATPQALSVAATYLVRRAGEGAPLAAVGASLGVPPVAAWAAADTRPRAAALLYGGGELWRLLAANLSEDVRSAWLRPIVARLLGAALRPIEPVRTVGRIAPRPLLVIASADDAWIPRRSVEALFGAAGEPKRLIWFRGVHLRTADAALLEALADSALAWLADALPGPAGRRP